MFNTFQMNSHDVSYFMVIYSMRYHTGQHNHSGRFSKITMLCVHYEVEYFSIRDDVSTLRDKIFSAQPFLLFYPILVMCC